MEQENQPTSRAVIDALGVIHEKMHFTQLSLVSLTLNFQMSVRELRSTTPAPKTQVLSRDF